MDALTIIENTNALNNLHKFCDIAIKSRMLPESVDTPQKAFIIAVKGIELGIAPMQAFSQIHVIKGRPAISAELMLGLIYRNVPTAEINFTKSDSNTCVIKCRRLKDQDFSEFSFTMEDAKRANLVPAKPDSGWTKYPQAMLRARAISSMARAIFPDAVMGASYTPEELQAPTGQPEGLQPPPIEIVSINEVPETLPNTVQYPPKYEIPEAIKQKIEAEKLIPTEPAVNPVKKVAPIVRDNPNSPMQYVIQFGKHEGRTIEDIGLHEAHSYARYLKNESTKSSKRMNPNVKEFLDKVDALTSPSQTLSNVSEDDIPF